jgi:pyruvate dehydrogenase E2 component (dihydrolipoamide acetyltransferase)
VPTPIRLPAVASDFESGTIAVWHKAIGDAVKVGDVLLDVETDKASVEVMALDSGVLGVILIPEGSENVPVNSVLGFLLKEGESAADISNHDPISSPDFAGDSQALSGPAPQPAKASPEQAPGRILASPVARRVAVQRGIQLSDIKGRGPNGRVLKADVEASIAPIASPPMPVTPRHGTAARSDGLDIPNTSIRKVIARRLTEAKREIPHFYLTVDCQIDALLEVRQHLNERSAPTGIKVSINDCVVMATALALVAVPAANASWSEEAIHQYGNVDISVAVATERGLITPIVRNADRKSLAEISQEIRELVTRALAGQLMPDEFKGGGFSISNLGMYGIKQFSAIINPPQSCILAVGAAERRPVVRDEKLGIATLMTCTLSVDHRSVDGAVGAEFLKSFKHHIERPTLLLLGKP